MDGDSIGKLPRPTSALDALKEVLFIAKDKRGHVVWEDHAKWLELKMTAIRKLAKRGIKAEKEKGPSV